MKKSQTNYYKNIGKWDERDTLEIEVNEEVKDHMKVKYFQERWRTKAEHIKLLKAIIKELENFNP